LPDVPRTDPAVQFSRNRLFGNTRFRASMTPEEIQLIISLLSNSRSSNQKQCLS